MPPQQRALRERLVKNLLEAPATAGNEVRAAAIANHGLDYERAAFVGKVAKWAYKVTDEDIAALTAAGVTEDEIFELAACAAVGESTRQLDAALAALKEA